MKYLFDVDFLGKPYSFGIMGNPTYRTRLGGLFTILSVIIIILLSINSGINFIKRNTFTMSSSSFKTKYYFNYTLNTNNFFFAFRLEDKNGTLIDKPQYLVYEPHYMVYNRTDDGLVSLKNDVINYRRCQKEDVNNSDFYTKLYLGNFYCLDFRNYYNSNGLTVGGLYDGRLIQYIKIRVKSCSQLNSSYNATNVTCSTNKTEYNMIFNQQILFSVFLQTFSLDGEDYNEPFKVEMNNFYDTIDLSIYKKSYFYFKKGILTDSLGWLYDSAPNITDIFGLDRIRYDLLTQRNDIMGAEFYQCNLYFDKINDTFKRRFSKLTEFLSEIGGLIKSVKMVFLFFIGFYNEFYQNRKLINNHFDIYEDMEESSLKLLKDIEMKASHTKFLGFNDNRDNIDEFANYKDQSKNQNQRKYSSTRYLNSSTLVNFNKKNKIFQEISNLKIIRKNSSRENIGNISNNLSVDNSNNNNLNPSLRKLSGDNKDNLNLTPSVILLPKNSDNLKKIQSPNKILISNTFIDYLRKLFCTLSKDKNFQNKLYKLGVDLINKKLDCEYILKHIIKTEKAMNLLLNDSHLNEIKKNPILNTHLISKLAYKRISFGDLVSQIAKK